MAWDSKASPWDWDNAAVLLQGHGTDFRKRVPENEWANEAEVGVTGHGPPQNGALCSNVSGLGASVTSFSSGLPGILGNGICGHSNFGSLDQRKLSVNHSTSNGSSFSVDCNDKCEGDNAGSRMQKRGHDTMNVMEERNVGFLELRSHASPTGIGLVDQVTTDHKGDSKPTAPEQHGSRSLIQPERQGRIFLGAGGGTGQDAKEGTGGAHLIEEQQSSTAAGSVGSGDSLIGLKLGKRTYFEDATGSAGTRAAPVSVVTNSVPPKKPRAASGGVQTPRCQVEGCKADLTSAKDYHRRHKVCEMHSKAGRVTVASQEQRFCQQCSRFHVLTEFDEGKRSCRRRLAGHNERRRKPQPDTLALIARLPSAFQDDRRGGHFYTEWPSFLHHPRIPGIPSLWEDSDDFRSYSSKGAWPRMMKLEDQPGYDCTMQAPGMERQLFLTGLSQNTNDKLPLLLLQSPKGMISMPNDIAGQRVHQYLQGSMGPNGHCLTLSSSSGTGVLSGLEATPATQGVTRVSDSGRALSLLSSQTWGSRAPVAVSLDLSTRTNITLDQLMHEDQAPVQQQLVQGGQQQHFDLTTEKLLSMASHSQSLSSSSGLPEGGMSSIEKEHHGGSFMHGLSGAGSFEGHPMFCTLQGQELRGPEDVRPTIDLMRISSTQSQSAQPQGSSVAFQLGSSPFGELQTSYESSIFDSQQMM